MMWIGSLALAGIGIPGVIGFAGFYSKDIILEAAYADHTWFGMLAFWLGIVAAFLTAFYSWRLLIMTFNGAPRADARTVAHVHESPWIMLGPLVVLAVGSVLAGAVFYGSFVGHHSHEFWGKAIFVLPENETAYWMYQIRPEMPARIQAQFAPLHAFFYNRWYFDQLYDAVFVRPARWLGFELWKKGDGAVIDAFGPDGLAALTREAAARSVRLQTGYVYHYAFAMVLGVVALIAWFWLAN
jgi:NADH-quinone oxidoreductase subunit L